MSNMFPVSTPSTSEWLCSHGVLSWKFPSSVGSYTLIGRSRAADATSFYIPELDMSLDCGCLVSIHRPLYIFITHCHSDHFLDVTRMTNRTRPPQIYLPSSAAQPMKDFIDKCLILRGAGRVDPDTSTWIPSYRLIGVQPDDILPFANNMQIRVFDMDHSVPCCGFGFYQCRQKLKDEYKHLSSKEIAQLKRENPNVQLSEPRTIPLFAFMGDTTASIFEKYSDELFQFPVIIVECSFIDNEEHAERASDVKHVIWVN